MSLWSARVASKKLSSMRSRISAVIDSVGIAGPRELDVASAALYNNWGEESSARIRRLAKLTGTDPAFALRFGQLSAMYTALAPRY